MSERSSASAPLQNAVSFPARSEFEELFIAEEVDGDDVRLCTVDAGREEEDVEADVGELAVAFQPDLFSADKACRDVLTTVIASLARSAGVKLPSTLTSDAILATGLTAARVFDGFRAAFE